MNPAAPTSMAWGKGHSSSQTAAPWCKRWQHHRAGEAPNAAQLGTSAQAIPYRLQQPKARGDLIGVKATPKRTLPSVPPGRWSGSHPSWGSCTSALGQLHPPVALGKMQRCRDPTEQKGPPGASWSLLSPLLSQEIAAVELQTVTPCSHQCTINQAHIFPLPRSAGFAAFPCQSLFSLLLISN